ncbi:DUF1322 family protein [Borreliella americana]|uniref:DUF1322 family protein n=1 Tax=Borreliella americana TaxID=478807 RepID=UPI001E5BCADB|nr:DUF1322 family protein [Borreliella americana]MCD2332802.1 DUF1322 family protein [Borreliella americana]
MKYRNRDIDKTIASINGARKKYFDLLEDIKNDKYYFPVIMNICSYDSVKKLPYDELLEVNRLADIKLEKELYELILSK